MGYETVEARHFEKLSEWVENNQIADIKAAVLQAKKIDGFSWYFSSNLVVECAVRDAILLGKRNIVEFFFAEGISASTHAYVRGCKYLRSLIGFAAESGSLAMVKLLLANKADITPRDSYFNRGNDDAIRCAVEGNHTAIVEYLLENGANVGGSLGGFHGVTFLTKAAQNKNEQMMEALIKHGANLEHAIISREHFAETMSDLDDDKQENLGSYSAFIKLLLDFAIGFDFLPERKAHDFAYSKKVFGGLNFLMGLDISDFSFIGISVDGDPVTRAMLVEKNFQGSKRAIVTLDNLEERLKSENDTARLLNIKKRVVTLKKQRGELISKEGIPNFVPLCGAAKVGCDEAVLTRLAAGVDPNEIAVNHDKKITPIALAAGNNHLAIVKMLALHPQFNPQSFPAAIKAASANNHQEIMQYLHTKQNINQVDKEGNTLLHIAVKKGDVEEVRRLLRLNADVSILSSSNGYALNIAASNSYVKCMGRPSKPHIEIIEILLEHKADPNLQTPWNTDTALNDAANAGSSEAVKLLLPVTHKQNADKQSPWYLDMMFGSYESSEWIEILKLLKAAGADLNAIHPSWGISLLHRAMGAMESFPTFVNSQSSFAEHLKIVEFLLDNGVDPNIKSKKSNETAVHSFLSGSLWRKQEEDCQVIEKCLQKGFKINEERESLLQLTRENKIVTQYLLTCKERVVASPRIDVIVWLR